MAIPSILLPIPSERVFRFTFQPGLFAWPSSSSSTKSAEEGKKYRYRPSLRGLPNLPNWMRYKYSRRHKAGFIYGVPPREVGRVVELEVVATDRDTYQTGLLRVLINITQGDRAPRAVKLKLDNILPEGEKWQEEELKLLHNLVVENNFTVDIRGVQVSQYRHSLFSLILLL